MRSIWQGWTSEKQRFVNSEDEPVDPSKDCAVQYPLRRTPFRLQPAKLVELEEVARRIVPMIQERFPGHDEKLTPDCEGLIYANDVLRLQAEVFVSLDLESQNDERRNAPGCESITGDDRQGDSEMDWLAKGSRKSNF